MLDNSSTNSLSAVSVSIPLKEFAIKICSYLEPISVEVLKTIILRKSNQIMQNGIKRSEVNTFWMKQGGG